MEQAGECARGVVVMGFPWFWAVGVFVGGGGGDGEGAGEGCGWEVVLGGVFEAFVFVGHYDGEGGLVKVCGRGSFVLGRHGAQRMRSDIGVRGDDVGPDFFPGDFWHFMFSSQPSCFTSYERYGA